MKDKLTFRIFSAFLSLLFVCLTTVTVLGNEEISEPQDLIDAVLEYNYKPLQEKSIQGFIDEALTEKAGISSEWYVIALSQTGNYDFSSYENALLEYLRNNETNSASTRLKYALALVAIGSDDEYIAEQTEKSIGEQGIMSLVYGLHILNNGAESEKHTPNTLIDKILSMQLDDGGWALNGKNADVDVTAMVIQSFAPFYNVTEKVKLSVDRAVKLLASRQDENGEFMSYGINNPESAAQVIVALSALGIDCKEDERFIKNECDLFDVISRYRNEDGGFSHIFGGTTNSNATVQVFFASVAYMQMKQGKGPLYTFDKNVSDSVSAPEESEPSQDEHTSTSNEASKSEHNDEKDNLSYKVYAIIIIALVSVCAFIALLIKKKINAKNILLLAVIIVAVLAFVLLTDFETKEGYYENAASEDDYIGTVTISIVCDVIDNSEIPNGVILKETVCNISEGDSVYEVLSEITAANAIHLETNGSGSSVYVEGIANVYEFDHGDLSGWQYLVNGEKPSVSCGEYIVKAGDKIEWIYSLSLGNDL